jgi:protein-tyrosine kinase
MADLPPDLIQRAAARLTKAGPARSEAAIEDARQPVAVATNADTGRATKNNRAAGEPPAISQRIVTLSPTSLAARGIVLPSAGFSRTVEEFRALKRSVLANVAHDRGMSQSGADRIVLVTSSNMGEGKTFVAINLALALAYEKDARVLLMDADAYRRSLLAYMGISADVGWIDYVANRTTPLDDLMLQTNVPNLSILPSGKERNEIPELMSSQQMKNLLDELTGQCPNRIIIVDSLPCLASTEPSILAALAGQTVFVVAAHQTSRGDLESSLRLVSASPNVSLLLNKAEPRLSEQFKAYGYGYQQQAGGKHP